MSGGPYPRHHRAVCGDADLASFMSCLLRFLAGARGPACFVDDDGIEREGIARTWEQWADELGLSIKQVRRILELATRLGYIVRARRTWGTHRVIRTHVAVTDVYVNELTRCVALDTKAYRQGKKATRQQAAAGIQVAQKSAIEGQEHTAHLGKIILPTEGMIVLPTEGIYIEDSSHTLSETLQGTAIPASAEDAQHGGSPLSSPGEEKSMTPTPHSPPSPGTDIAGAGVANGTVTAEGLATKLRNLGLLVEWQRACAEFKHPNPETPSDAQLAALACWCERKRAESRPEDSVRDIIRRWHEFVTVFSDAEDVPPELNLRSYIGKPSLEFVRRVVGVLMAGETAPPPN